MQDEPLNRFEEHEKRKQEQKPVQAPTPVAQSQASRAASAPQATPAAAKQQPERVVPDANAIKRAQELAQSAQTLEQLKEIVMAFDGCNLRFAAKSTVVGNGDPNADIMLIGATPELAEDQQGEAFCGLEGQLLEKMLAAIGLERTNCYLTPAVPWRPAGNKAPSQPEIDICLPFLKRQIELVQPKHILAFGGLAVRMLTGSKNAVMNQRGRWHDVTMDDAPIPAMVTLSPAYLLKHSAHKRMAWHDLLAFKQRLTEGSGH